jgi:adenylosuccinate synthase
MSENLTILGLQWGDEGKGKVVDYFTEGVDIVARFGGGANAGHTVVNDKGKFILHLLPSGIIHKNVQCFMGGGMVCDPVGLFEEIDDVKSKGIDCSNRLHIDYNTHLVLPHHKAIEKYYENLVKGKSINTTLRGIGPAYADKANRFGFTAGDLLDYKLLSEKTQLFVEKKKAILSATGDTTLLEPSVLLDFLKFYAEKLNPMIVDVTLKLKTANAEGKKILFEGSQGSLLDISLGNYPYVTSSNTTIGGLFTGLGMPPDLQGEVLGVVKAYSTRVGNGPFPTELKDATGDTIREKGGEYGATTGRPRRIGWLDTAIVKRTVYMSGVSGIVITKLDVLDGMDELKVCNGHRIDGKTYDFPPLFASFMEKAEPVYETFPGWKSPTANLTDYAKLPAEAMAYIDYIEKQIEIPVKYISTGFKRDAFIKKS